MEWLEGVGRLAAAERLGPHREVEGRGSCMYGGGGDKETSLWAHPQWGPDSPSVSQGSN